MNRTNTEKLTRHDQKARGHSPWSLGKRLGLQLWQWSWFCFCVWTPKPCNAWRLLWLKLFGCEIDGTPFVHQRARIHCPWNLSLGDKSCIGDRANIYTLDRVVLKEFSTIAQEAYLCTGTHDFTSAEMNLVTAPILVERGAFVSARAFVLPGRVIGEQAIVGAGAIVSKDVEPYAIVAGNPARKIGERARDPR